MAASRDTEITLGTGRMLALFFGLVGICALFFGLGYSLGKSSSKPPIMAEQPPIKSEPKPAPPKPAASAKPGDMTFYQAVKQDDTTAQTPPASPAPADSSDSPVAAATAAEVNPQPLVGTIDNGGYFVQVAAVSKKEDAEALLSALKKKAYPVSIGTNEPHDRFYHVQVGPFGNIKDAEATRSKLVADGYNPILKK
ncbi:MAG TPA: SPOR domain-containing protein [Terriglobales bacterium]|nr:SPOR domain-containing protein [Terriglobales bacterium]